MSEIDDFKHLWKYEINNFEKVMIGLLVIGVIGTFAGSESLGVVALTSFALLAGEIIVKHN